MEPAGSVTLGVAPGPLATPWLGRAAQSMLRGTNAAHVRLPWQMSAKKTQRCQVILRDRLLVTGLLAPALLVALGGVSAAQGGSLPDARLLQASVDTSFTYQGSLTQGDSPVNAPHELRFILYDADAGGSQVGETLTVPDVPVENGVFTVPIDFGPGIFDGRALWLEVAVRPNGSTGAFTTLSPRQRLTAAPYASYAAGSWNLKGNAGTDQNESFIGTTDAAPLVVKTGNIEAMRVGADGSVGVGTGDPQARLEVVAPSGGTALMGSSTGRGVVGRIGTTPCGGQFAVGGCAGDSGITGVVGHSSRAFGVRGNSSTSVGGGGNSWSNTAVQGVSGTGFGVHGVSNTNTAVVGGSTSGIGVLGESSTRGVVGVLGAGSCPGTYGVGGCAGGTGGYGVIGVSDSGVGVRGTSNTSRAVEGFSTSGIGVIGDSASRGVIGTLGRASCAGSFAVGGCAGGAVAAGVYGQSNAAAIFARSDSGDLFVGVTGDSETHRARIDVNGRGYFNNGTQTGGADYAESMRTTDDPAKLEPGDVLSLDPESGYAVRLSREAISRLVAGVYSTRPSLLAIGEHHIDDDLAGEVPVALLGVVPTKVTAANGPIQIGDLLVTSAMPGRAMKAKPDVVDGVLIYPTGAILGKALEPLLSGTGVIKVLVTLR